VIYRTFESVDTTGRFDEELVYSLPASVKFICHNGMTWSQLLSRVCFWSYRDHHELKHLQVHLGAGYDQVDVQACRKRDIKVSNTPNVVNDSTADTAMFLMLGALRRLNVPMTTLREGSWRGHHQPPIGHDPEGKTLGILGMGGIGQNLCKKAEAFGMRVIYHNRCRLGKERAGTAEYVTFEDLLEQSDVLSVNLPLNVSACVYLKWRLCLPHASLRPECGSTLMLTKTETRHIISTHEFGQMRDGVVIVNTARGAVLDEGALVEALDSGKVASAGLDVYEDEPNIHPGLATNRHVLLLPHMGTWTVEVSLRCSLVAIWCISVMRFTRRAIAQYVVQDVQGVVSNAQGCNAAVVLYAAGKGCGNTDIGREREQARRTFLLTSRDVLFPIPLEGKSYYQ
jgi:glyoxylate reductase